MEAVSHIKVIKVHFEKLNLYYVFMIWMSLKEGHGKIIMV